MSRKDDLEQSIRESYEIIDEYQAVIRTSERAEEKARARRIIREQRVLIGGYQAELGTLTGDAEPSEAVQRGSPLPELTLRLFKAERDRTYRDEITLGVPDRPAIWIPYFGLALENTTKATHAKGIGITLQLSWGGGQHLQKAPDLVPPEVEGWKTVRPRLVNESAAMVKFSDLDLVCFHSQPEEWWGFKLGLYEKWAGHFRLDYVIASMEPSTERSGSLKIIISH